MEEGLAIRELKKEKKVTLFWVIFLALERRETGVVKFGLFVLEEKEERGRFFFFLKKNEKKLKKNKGGGAIDLFFFWWSICGSSGCQGCIFVVL